MPLPLPQDVAESPSLARTTAQAPWLRGPGSQFISQIILTSGRSALIKGVVAGIGAWAKFCSNGLLAERLGSVITAHGPWE